MSNCLMSRGIAALALSSMLLACGGGGDNTTTASLSPSFNVDTPATPVSTTPPVAQIAPAEPVAPVTAAEPAPLPVVVAPVEPVQPITQNIAPVADAGVMQSVYVGALATLDGSRSTDADSNVLTYVWKITSAPSGSSAALSSTTALKPSFTPDRAGVYEVSLIVNDGTLNSGASTVQITAAVLNLAPVASAGTSQNVNTGAVVTLDGSASNDGNGDAITYAWTLTAPSGSTASLSGATTAQPQFTADLVGSYTANLIVSDGRLSSAPALVTVTATVANAAPVANAGANRTLSSSALVTLSGSASSDANGDALTYLWSLTSIPSGSTAVLSSSSIVNPTFTPDVVGDYVVQLIVNDGQANSAPATVTVSLTPNLVRNGSFENGLTSWSFAGVNQSATNPSCSYNVAVSPGTETLTGQPGFPATDGNNVALGSSSSDSGYYSCTLYQDITIPADANGLTFTFDIGNRFINAGAPCLFIGLYPSNAVPGYPSNVVGGQRIQYCQTADTALTPQTMTYTSANVQSLRGTLVRVAFINAMYGGPGSGIIGIDKVRISTVP